MSGRRRPRPARQPRFITEYDELVVMPKTLFRQRIYKAMWQQTSGFRYPVRNGSGRAPSRTGADHFRFLRQVDLIIFSSRLPTKTRNHAPKSSWAINFPHPQRAAKAVGREHQGRVKVLDRLWRAGHLCPARDARLGRGLRRANS
jgi:hypothetical protein